MCRFKLLWHKIVSFDLFCLPSWYQLGNDFLQNVIFYAYADLQKVLEKNKVEATPNLFNPKWLVR